MINQINIERKLPIINGFIQIPDGEILLRNMLTPDEAIVAIPDASVKQISGNMRSDREWLILPAVDREPDRDVAPSDFFQTLRDAV